MKAAYKYRFYPDKQQEALLGQSFGCVRFVWNKVLGYRNEQFEAGNKINSSDAMKYLTDLKKEPEFIFLNHVSSVALQQSVRNQNKAYDNFFAKRAKFPRFKKRHNRQSLQLMANAFSIKNNEVYIAKSKKPLNITWSRPITGKISSLTISKEPSGKYYISFIAEKEQKILPVVNKTCGIDIGLKDLLCFDNGEKVQDLKAYLLYEKLVLIAQRKLSRFDERRKKLGLKVRDSSIKRERLRKKLARLREKITCIKRDYMHKLTTKIINENQVIYVEDLGIKNMIKNRKLSRRIQEASWGEILRQLMYKAEWYGRTIVKINRWYPSSKKCSTEGCNYKKDKLPLSIREWTCPCCGIRHDRDINAARNIKAAGQAALASRVTVAG